MTTNTNPNGTLLLDTTQAKQGETATITVTATEPADHTTVSQSFVVTVGAYGGPASPTINFRPFANATTATVAQGTLGPGAAQRAERVSQHIDSEHAHVRAAQSTDSRHGQQLQRIDRHVHLHAETRDFSGRIRLKYQVTATGPADYSRDHRQQSRRRDDRGRRRPRRETCRSSAQALVVQPPPKFHGKNHIHIAQVPIASANGGAVIQVNINGELDSTQPGINDINRIIVFGGRTARNQIVVDPSVQLATTIDSGHGTVAFLTGGGGPTREHGWFGHTTLIGGPGANQLIGLAGKVKFKPSKETTLIFAGKPRRRTSQLNTLPPGGTYYKFVNGHLVPIPASEVKFGHTNAITTKANGKEANRGGSQSRRADGESQDAGAANARFDKPRPASV